MTLNIDEILSLRAQSHISYKVRMVGKPILLLIIKCFINMSIEIIKDLLRF